MPQGGARNAQARGTATTDHRQARRDALQRVENLIEQARREGAPDDAVRRLTVELAAEQIRGRD